MKLEPYIILLSFFFLLKQTDFYFVCNFESTSEIASSWQKTLPAQDSIYVLWPRPFFWNTVILQTFCSQFVDISENYFVSYIYQKIKVMYIWIANIKNRLCVLCVSNYLLTKTTKNKQTQPMYFAKKAKHCRKNWKKEIATSGRWCMFLKWFCLIHVSNKDFIVLWHLRTFFWTEVIWKCHILFFSK